MGRKSSAYRFAKKSGLGRPGKAANILSPGTYGGQTTQPQPSTYGLNAANQQLAEIGESIPVLFGDRRESNGGFVHTPSLIYQRMYSQGTYQETRIGFVIGEGGVELKKPSNRGIRIGKDLLNAKQPEFYQIRFTDGKGPNNQPDYGNTDPWGQKYISPDTLDESDRFLVVRDPDREVSGLSQCYDPSKSFGLESEQPDCAQTYDQEFTTLIPFPALDSTPLIKYSPVDASIGNTRNCRTTEFGFAIDLPQPAVVVQEDGPVVGSKWVYRKLLISPLGTRFCYSSYEPYFYGGQKYLPPIIGTALPLDDGMEIEIISADTAFYAIYRPFYKNTSQELIAQQYNIFLNQFGSWVFFIEHKKLPSPIYAIKPGEFGPDQPNGYSWFERKDGQFATGNFNTVDPCEFVDLDPETLLDTNVPKMFFKLFYRKLDDSQGDWKPVCREQFCLLSPDASTLYASVQVHHPGLREEAYEYRFKATTPLQYETDSQAVYEKCKYGVKTGAGTTNQKSYVLYPKGQQERTVNGLDGFKLTFKGLIEDVVSEIKLDAQATSFKCDISYVNEFLKDVTPKYPYMSTGVLELRAGKGLTSLEQLSMFYSSGMQIKRCDLTEGASDLFGDLVFYLLHQYPGKIPGPVEPSQFNSGSFIKANDYTESKNLKYNGVISERVGIHEFISEHAKYFLLRFGTRNGEYFLFPALNDSETNTPAASAGQVVTMDMVDAKSFEIDYATLSQREEGRMQVIWRRQDQNMPGVNESVTVQPRGYVGTNKTTHDISGFCTSKEHAITVARFLSAMRNEQDRVATFSCADQGVDLTPGRLFVFDLKVETSAGTVYTNTDQYQVTSCTYREDGMLDVTAAYLPSGINDMVFDDQTYEEVD